MNKDAFCKRLAENYYGENPEFAEPGKKINEEMFCGLVVIEGKIVKPKSVETVTKYKID